MKNKLILLMAVIVIAAFLMTSCVPGDGKNTAENPAGFFWGAWHGMIIPVTFVISLFKEDRGVFEQNNNGAWYSVGYALGVLFMLSTLGVTRVKKKKKR